MDLNDPNDYENYPQDLSRSTPKSEQTPTVPRSDDPNELLNKKIIQDNREFTVISYNPTKRIYYVKEDETGVWYELPQN